MEKYSFKGSVFNIYQESKSEEETIGLKNIDNFKNYAAGLQKHETSIKNIIFVKK